MDLKIFSGQASRELAEKICQHLGMSLGASEFVKFSDTEFEVRFCESVRGKDVYIVQSTYEPAANHLKELTLWIDAAKRAAAKLRGGCITAVIPY